MFTKVGTWTDPHGVTHTDAVFQMAHANFSQDTSSGDSFILDISDGFGNMKPTETTNQGDNNNGLNYKVYYWASQTSKDNGDMPFTLMNHDGAAYSDSIHVTGLGAEYDGLTAEKKADKHCQEIIIL